MSKSLDSNWQSALRVHAFKPSTPSGNITQCLFLSHKIYFPSSNDEVKYFINASMIIHMGTPRRRCGHVIFWGWRTSSFVSPISITITNCCLYKGFIRYRGLLISYWLHILVFWIVEAEPNSLSNGPGKPQTLSFVFICFAHLWTAFSSCHLCLKVPGLLGCPFVDTLGFL